MRLLSSVFFLVSSLLLAGTPVTVLRAKRYLEVAKGTYVSPTIILIEGERIKELGPEVKVPKGAEVIDLGEATLLPGLIDAHTHLLTRLDPSSGDDMAAAVIFLAQTDLPRRALLGAAMGREMLEAGFTSVRDLGNSGHGGDAALRDAIKAGWVVGPRLQASTRALSPTGGQFGPLAPVAKAIVSEECAEVTDPVEARKAVREAIGEGADIIKVIVNAGPKTLSIEEMKAIAEEAHRSGRKIAAHATSFQSTKEAAEAGVDSVEHAYNLSDELLALPDGPKTHLPGAHGRVSQRL